MKNIKVKQRKCPFGKVELCDSYGNCGDCTWCKVIEKYEKKIKALQDKNAELLETAETEESNKRNLQTYIDNHEEVRKRNTEIAEKVARKEVAKEILQEFWKIEHGQTELDNVCIRLAEKYGVFKELQG